MKHDKRNVKLIAMIVMIGISATALTACLSKCSNKGVANETVESVIATESVETTEASEPTSTPTVTVKPTVTPNPTATVTPTTAVTEDGGEGIEATTTATATPTTAGTKPTAAVPTEAPATQPAATEVPAPTEAPATQPTATEAPAATATPTPEPTAEPTPEPTEVPEPLLYCTADVTVNAGAEPWSTTFTIYGVTLERKSEDKPWHPYDYDSLEAEIYSTYAQWYEDTYGEPCPGCGRYGDQYTNIRDIRANP